MKYVKALNPYEVFMANIEAGNDVQLIIRDLVESYGLKIDNKHGPGNITAVSTLESVFTKYGYHTLDRTLRLCIGTWEGESNSLSANMLNVVSKLIVTYGEALNDELFKEKLGMSSVKLLIRTAKERGPGSVRLAEAMILIYNGKKKGTANKLNIRKLYEKTKTYAPEDDMLNDEAALFNAASE